MYARTEARKCERKPTHLKGGGEREKERERERERESQRSRCEEGRKMSTQDLEDASLSEISIAKCAFSPSVRTPICKGKQVFRLQFDFDFDSFKIVIPLAILNMW